MENCRLSYETSRLNLTKCQFDYLVKGYNDYVSDPSEGLKPWQLYLLNMVGDLDDLIPALQYQQTRESFNPANIEQYILNSHCSSIVKPNDDFSELFAAHEVSV